MLPAAYIGDLPYKSAGHISGGVSKLQGTRSESSTLPPYYLVLDVDFVIGFVVNVGHDTTRSIACQPQLEKVLEVGIAIEQVSSYILFQR